MSLRILVVDDDASARELMKETLSSLGMDVSACGDSEEAYRRINTGPFDGIFLDLLMPKMSGFDLTHAIRHSQWNRHCPIVIISGSDDRESMARAFAAGGNFFLRKPVDRRRLQTLLNASHGSMLGNRRGFSRVALDVEITCHSGAAVAVKGKAANISERGILICNVGNLTTGQQVRLRFGLPAQNTEIQTTGVVTRLADAGRVGVSFTQIRGTDRQRIRLFVADSVNRKLSGIQTNLPLQQIAN
jgi:CheY-like chemotaxis protein